MARRTRRMGGRRTTIQVVEDTLRDLADDLSNLEDEAFERMWRGSLTDVAEDAVTRLADVFEKEIEGGPVDHTKIVPNSKQSSVINNKAAKKSGTEVLRSSIKTQRSQSTYLKYALGEEDDREAGDTGVAAAFNFIPNVDAMKRHQGIAVDRHGNLPRNALETLSKRSQRSTTKASFGSSKGDRGGQNDLFFGKSGRRDTLGFWQRAAGDDGKGRRAPELLVLAVPRSEYDDDLQQGWNRSVGEAMEGLPRIVQRRLAHVLAAMG